MLCCESSLVKQGRLFPFKQTYVTSRHLKYRAANCSVLQNSCSSGRCLLAGRFGKNNMSLEEKCCLEIENSVCVTGFAESKTNIYTC